LVFALIACVGLLTSNFNRRGQSKIIFSSIAAIILVQAIDLTSGNWACKSFWWLILLYANILLPIIFCTILLIKPNLFRSLKHRFSSSLAEEQ
jgi:membrane protein YdbS with pleckstrin-like domain